MTTGLELLNEIADRIGWPQITTLETSKPTSEARKLLTALNRVLRTLQSADDWPLLRTEGYIAWLDSETSDLTTGLEQYVTATQNSTTLTVANGTFTSVYVGRAIQVSGFNTVYRIDKALSATDLELNRAWVDTSITVADEHTFTVAMDRYALPDDFDRPVDDWQSFLKPYKIIAISPENFRERRRRQPIIQPGNPSVYTIFGTNDGETAQLVHFDTFPSTARLITFDYIRIHPEINSDNDKILFPAKQLEIVIDGVIHLAKRDYADSDKADQALSTFIMQRNQQLAVPSLAEQPHIIRPNKYKRALAYRNFGTGARIDWGDYFDQAGNIELWP